MSSDYNVGYGKPPPEHRFKPGRSGNPKGRPRTRRTHSEIVAAVRDELVPVIINGKKKMVTSFEAVLRTMFARCLQKGRPADLEKLIDLMETRGAAQADVEAMRTKEAADKVLGTIADVFRKTREDRRAKFAVTERRADEEVRIIQGCEHCRTHLEARWAAERKGDDSVWGTWLRNRFESLFGEPDQNPSDGNA